jgi:hypothetical protein
MTTASVLPRIVCTLASLSDVGLRVGFSSGDIGVYSFATKGQASALGSRPYTIGGHVTRSKVCLRLNDLAGWVHTGSHRKDLLMEESEGSPQNAKLDAESPTDEATADVNQESGEEDASSDYQKEAEEAASADYQERMEAFDNADASVPVTTMPTASGQE